MSLNIYSNTVMLMYSRQSFHPIVSRDQYTTTVFIQRTLNIDPPIHRAVLYRPLYISVYRYIIPNVNPSIMLSGPFHIIIIPNCFLYFKWQRKPVCQHGCEMCKSTICCKILYLPIC